MVVALGPHPARPASHLSPAGDNRAVVTIPAFVWRGGVVRRALTLGGSVGLCLGVLAWLDSGFWLTGVIVFVVVGAFYGTWMARRMTKYWPQWVDLAADERVSVVSAARTGGQLAEARLAPALVTYVRGLHAAAEDARPLRWVVIVVLIVAIGTAVWDVVLGTWGNAIVSAVYLFALMIEILWWPKRQKTLLDNADRAARPRP